MALLYMLERWKTKNNIMTIPERIRKKHGIVIRGVEYTKCYEDVRKIMLANIKEHTEKMDVCIKDEDWEYAAKHKSIRNVLIVISGSMDEIFSYSS